jgi:hypothetical protein
MTYFKVEWTISRADLWIFLTNKFIMIKFYLIGWQKFIGVPGSGCFPVFHISDATERPSV